MGNRLDCQQIGLEYGVKLERKKETKKKNIGGAFAPLHPPGYAHAAILVSQVLPLCIACGSNFLCIVLNPLYVVLMLAKVICILKIVPNHNSAMDMMLFIHASYIFLLFMEHIIS